MHVNGAADGPNGLLELIEARLREMPPGNYALTRHVELKCGQRGIPIELIVENLSKPDNLALVKREEVDPNPNKYLLNFRYTKKKDLAIIVEFVDKRLNIITAYPVNRRWAKRVGECLNKLRRRQ